MNQTVISRPQVLSQGWGHRVAKRILDLGLCLVAIIFVLPLMALISFLVILDSPGPALFVQERVGRGGRRFRMYKFRTMQWNLDDAPHQAFMRAFVKGEIADAPSEKAVFKPFRDSQVTRLGRILRKTSLDELPQIINVLRGEMSLVGPRPNVPYEVDAYKTWHLERLKALPGLTGLAQVNGRSCISFDRIVEYDIEYIESQSLWLDLKILWWTVRSVILADGAH
jgi:lipopolysaccharide/colanic/teichoic acid biosynthesis glycosyltransferase